MLRDWAFDLMAYSMGRGSIGTGAVQADERIPKCRQLNLIDCELSFMNNDFISLFCCLFIHRWCLLNPDFSGGNLALGQSNQSNHSLNHFYPRYLHPDHILLDYINLRSDIAIH